jgi:hypothetical protein
MAMPTLEEEEHRDEIIQITEEVLDAKGLACDARISKISEEQLRDILEEVRKLRRKRRRMNLDDEYTEEQKSTENTKNEYDEGKAETPYVTY